jgi:hypothetical protein
VLFHIQAPEPHPGSEQDHTVDVRSCDASQDRVVRERKLDRPLVDWRECAVREQMIRHETWLRVRSDTGDFCPVHIKASIGAETKSGEIKHRLSNMALCGVRVSLEWSHSRKEQRVISGLSVKGCKVALESSLIANAPIGDHGIIRCNVGFAHHSCRPAGMSVLVSSRVSVGNAVTGDFRPSTCERETTTSP